MNGRQASRLRRKAGPMVIPRERTYLRNKQTRQIIGTDENRHRYKKLKKEFKL